MNAAEDLPPTATAQELQQAETLISSWATTLVQADGPVASIERGAAHRLNTIEQGWYLRLGGNQKQFFSIWFELGQRTLQYESYFMPAPLENAAALYSYLMAKNYTAQGVSFAIGPESAIYLVGRFPVVQLNETELDRILGTVYSYTEQHFRPAMRLGFGEKFKG